MLATKTEIKIKQCVLHGAVHSLFLLYIHMHTHTPSLSEITSTVTLSLPFHTQHMHTAEYILRGWRLMEGATMLSLSSHISAIEAPVHTMLFITMQLQNNGAELAPISIPHQGNKVSTPSWPTMPTRNMSIPFLLFLHYLFVISKNHDIMPNSRKHRPLACILPQNISTSGKLHRSYFIPMIICWCVIYLILFIFVCMFWIA